MFEGMDIPWAPYLGLIKKKNKPAAVAAEPAPAPDEPGEDIAHFSPAAFELVKRILARALAPFPEAARSVGSHLRTNSRALFNYGLPAKAIDFDALIVSP